MKPFFFRNILPVFIFAVIILNGAAIAQDTTKSLAFKNNRPRRNSPYYYRPDLGYQIWQQFKLIQEANEGDSFAQHELGLRYLLGEGMTVDTVKAAYWIKKAADQKLPAAMYNYGIMLFNGVGVRWNPFEAFKYFKQAANAGMAQAQYIVGILYTDNLLVKRNYNYAYYWLEKSAGGDYKPAKSLVPQLEKHIDKAVVDSIKKITKNGQESELTENNDKTDDDLSSPVGLVFINFDTKQDTIREIADSLLIADLQYAAADSIVEKLKIDSLTYLSGLTEKNVSMLIELAGNGSPEAQTILGRMYELGIGFPLNKIKAGSYYFRALRLDSPKAPFLLWKLSRSSGFMNEVQQQSDKGNFEAKFVWYGLSSAGYDNRIAMSDAVNLLKSAAGSDYIPALIELGLDYYTGRFLDEDKEKGLEIWRKAASLGSLEASVRLISASIFNDDMLVNPTDAYNKLSKAADEGSVLAMVTLAYCNENGIGTTPSIPNAVKYYRYSAQRGSQYAYRELERLYDSIRPNDPEFSIN